MQLKKQPLLLSCSFFLINIVPAQNIAGKSELGFHVGTFIHQGDLTPNVLGSFKTARPTFGIYYNHVLTPYFSLRGNLDIGSISGDDAKFANPAYKQHRNFNFSTPITELSVLGSFNPFGNNGMANDIRLNVYAFGGLGYSFLNIKRDYSQFDTAFFAATKVTNGLALDSAKALPRSTPIIPLGLGIKYRLSTHLSLTAEANYRFTFSDYIDGFSYAANPKLKDSYTSLTVGLVYNFGRSNTACPANW